MEIIEQIYKIFCQKGRVTTDSRDIQPGDIFIALKGKNHNGNIFAKQAINQGAACAIVDEEEYADGQKCILVPDCLQFLQQLAHHHRKQLNIPILGITGTNGKTTTKELCLAVISQKYKTIATQGNLNNHIGVPLTLLSMPRDTEFGIVEMGANHPGEIKALCDIVEPNLGIITNIGCAHIEGFGSQENIIQTKRALYDAVNRCQGTLFVNGEDNLLMGLTTEPSFSKTKIVTYGTQDCFTNGEIAQSVPYLVYTLKTRKGHLYIRTKLIGEYNFPNAMAASALGLYFQIDPLSIQSAIENYKPSNMRSQLLKTEKNTVILDAYNANPSSMKVAIDNFGKIQEPHKIIIAGEMKELGDITTSAHRQILQQIKDTNITRAFVVGKVFEGLVHDFPNAMYFEDTDTLAHYLQTNPISSSFILVKGSRGNQLEKIIQYL